MNVNTTGWNRIRYSVYAPVYDMVESLVGRGRRQAINQLAPKAGEKILLVGCGTGLDLEYLPEGLEIIAVDLTPAMVKKTIERAERIGITVDARVMDAESLDFDNETFDCVILHLILAIVPKPAACINEAARVLKSEGRMSIFDKFLRQGQKPSLIRKAVNTVSNLLFTDINRELEPLVKGAGLVIIEDNPALLGRLFRTITASKDG